MVPEGWENSLLDDAARRRSGHTPDKTKPHYWNGGIKWVSLADSNKLDGGTIYATDKEISEEGLKNSSAVMLPKGTVVLSRDAGVGKSAVLGDNMAVSQHFIAWTCGKQSKLDNWFLYYWMQMKKPLFERMAVGSTIKTIGLPFFKKLRIAHPPLPEQRKIADILSTWDAAIEKTEALLATAKAQKRALMQSLLTGKRRFPEFEGQEWKEVRLGDVMSGKKTKGKIVATNVDDDGQPYIGAASFEGKFSTFTSDPNAVYCEPSDLLVLWDGENAGAVAVGLSGAVSSTVVRFRFDEALVSAGFVAAQMKLKNYQIRAVREGSGIPHMPKDFETWFRFLLPSVPEQKQIMRAIDGAQHNISAITADIEKLRTEKKALMQQLLTGKRRVMV